MVFSSGCNSSPLSQMFQDGEAFCHQKPLEAFWPMSQDKPFSSKWLLQVLCHSDENSSESSALGVLCGSSERWFIKGSQECGMEDVTKDCFLLLWVLGMNPARWECQANTLPLSYILDHYWLLLLTQKKTKRDPQVNTLKPSNKYNLTRGKNPAAFSSKLEISHIFYIKTLPLLFRGWRGLP